MKNTISINNAYLIIFKNMDSPLKKQENDSFKQVEIIAYMLPDAIITDLANENSGLRKDIFIFYFKNLFKNLTDKLKASLAFSVLLNIKP